jgi:hypothetical protein
MHQFLQQHAGSVTGAISGWDRLRFRGTLRMLANVTGLGRFLSSTRHLMKDFGKYAHELSQQVRAASLAVAESAGRPVVHLNGPSVSKEDTAREIAKRDGIKEGPICVLTSVDPCWSYNIQSNRKTGHLDLIHQYRKCQHLYHYQIHPVLGFMHLRLQTWLPFNITVNVNGREWLGRQMDAAGIGYKRHENCFTSIGDLPAAQALLDEQINFDWATALGTMADEVVNPFRKTLVGNYDIPYYWSLDQSEWATDVLFRSPDALAKLYPSLIRHGIESFGSPEVMRFLGRSVARGITPRFSGEVTSDVCHRPEGVRIKHRVNLNSIKMYDKAGSVLRIETTLNNVREIKAPRLVEGKKVWMPMRKGVADIPKRAEVSSASNGRYLEALAAVKTPLPLKNLTEKLGQPVKWKEKQTRGLNLLGKEDAALLQAAGRGEFLITGLRNRDLQALLFSKPADGEKEKRRRSGQVTRKLRMLRAHGLIHKLPHTHRYMVSEKGRQVITALLAAREADIEKLSKAA